MAGIQIDGVNNKIDFDDDADTSISSATDDTLVVEVGGNTLATVTSTSVTINDGTTIITNDNSDTLTLQSADDDASEGPVMVFDRASSSPADDDVLGAINFRGKDSGGNGVDYVKIQAEIMQESDGSEDGQLQFNVQKSGTSRNILTLDRTAVVINEDSQDIDFRVESEGGTHAFFVNAASNNGCAGFYSASDSAQLFIENQNAAGGRNALFINNPSSTDTATGVNARTTRSSSLSSNVYFLGASNSGSDAEFRVRGDGEVSADGSFTGGGADYAEYFEWKDGNASDEDRVGYSVVLDGNKIVKATNSDDVSKIIGVISADPAVVGDGDIDRWKQKFLLDDFGREITEEITVTEWRGEHTTDEGIFNKNYLYSYDTDRIPSDVTVPSDAEVKSVDDNGNKFLRRKTNPDWNESETYISREDRKEWDTVGLMGKLRLRKGQPTGTNWIKMRDISDSVEEWLVR